MQTGQWYYEQALRRIRVTPDARLDMVDVVNRAGQELINARQWDFWLRERYDAAAVVGQDYIALPRGWQQVFGVISKDPGRFIEVCTLARFEEIRTRVLVEPNMPWRWRIALDTVPVESPDTTPRLGYRVWPTPTQAGLPTIRARGRKGWAPFSSTSLTLKPTLPDQWHPALFLAVQCVAVETLRPADGPAPERPLLEQAIEKLWENEQDMETDAGELRGGVDDMRDPMDARVVDWSTFPGT